MTTVTTDGVVEFRFYRPDVRQVSVVGSFNGWRRDELPMRAQGDGWWRAEIQLHGGDYRFRYLADDKFFPDYASNGIDMGKFGWESLLFIPKTAGRQQAIRHDARLVA
jgi:1,4-alpha-glucan branching enzyme